MSEGAERLVVRDEAELEALYGSVDARSIDAFQPGLLAAVLGCDAAGRVVRKAGIMAIVIAGGDIRPGNAVELELPPEPHRPLERV